MNRDDPHDMGRSHPSTVKRLPCPSYCLSTWSNSWEHSYHSYIITGNYWQN